MEGNQILDTQYLDINFNGIYIMAQKEDSSIVYFDINGKEIEDNKYESLLKTDNENYFIGIDQEGRYHIVDKNNEILLQDSYTYIEYLFKDYFIVAKDNSLLGIIDLKGNIKIDFQYEVLQKMEHTQILVAKKLVENKIELYTNNLDEFYEKENLSLSIKENKYIQAYSKEETKYFDFNGNELENTQIFQNKLYSKIKNGKWGFVDINGNVIIDFLYDRTTEFTKQGYAGIKIGNKWGVIKEDGSVIIEPIYEIETGNLAPEFAGIYYKVYYGYGESYYTDEVKD